MLKEILKPLILDSKAERRRSFWLFVIVGAILSVFLLLIVFSRMV